MMSGPATLLTVLLLLPAMASAHPAPGPTAEQEEFACDVAGTICAVAVTFPRVTCEESDALVTCRAQVPIGGIGFSPKRLPGRMAWNGTASCGGICTEAPVSAGGSGSWSGGVGPIMAPDGILVLFPNITFERPVQGCVSYTVQGDVTAQAHSLLDLTETTVATTGHAQATICGE